MKETADSCYSADLVQVFQQVQKTEHFVSSFFAQSAEKSVGEDKQKQKERLAGICCIFYQKKRNFPAWIKNTKKKETQSLS